MSWLDELLYATEENESPERYFWWSGLATISAIARKNVFIERHFYKLYPNIYVALISSRSGGKKGIPISICKKLLETVGTTRIISGCNSIQGLIQELSMQRTLSPTVTLKEAHGIMLSDEFDSFLTDDPKCLTYLTALHNTHEHEKGWTKRLKGSPVEELRSPCLTMLVASNETLFDSMVKHKDIEGGFIGRTFVVYEKRSKEPNSLVYAPKHKINFHDLSLRLLKISKLKGEFKWSTRAGEKYDRWYKQLHAQNIDDRTGSINRLGDQVVKAAMLISLARKDELTLEMDDVEMAIDKCTECAITAMRMISTTGGTNGTVPNATGLVTKIIVDAANHTITRQKLLSKLYPYNVQSYQLDKVIETMMGANWITAFRNGDKVVCYKLTEEGYAQLCSSELTSKYVKGEDSVH